MAVTGSVILSLSEASQPVKDAFAECERLAKSHYENFSVATRLLPSELIPHFHSVYAFCRGVDDIGDAPHHGDRLALLDDWETELDACYEGIPSHAYFVALQQTIRQFEIPREPFRRLIEANRIDQETQRYENFDQLLRYCTYSANPVGQLVLRLFGYGDPERQRLSDYTCTALQLTNFWQDVARDYEIGRIYIPQDTLIRFGASEADIENRDPSPRFKAALAFEVGRARDLFRRGMPLIDRVSGKARIDIALFTAGGIAILDQIRKADYDVLARRPRISKFGKARLFASAWVRSKLGLHPLSRRMRS